MAYFVFGVGLDDHDLNRAGKRIVLGGHIRRDRRATLNADVGGFVERECHRQRSLDASGTDGFAVVRHSMPNAIGNGWLSNEGSITGGPIPRPSPKPTTRKA